MQHLNACLSKCDDSQYKNIVFNSAINCTPFEAGHGLRAKAITEARVNPRLQINAEEGTDIQRRRGHGHFPKSADLLKG
jgi:hypothetical protein